MPPKAKEPQAPKNLKPSVNRPPISNSSLVFVPEDAVEGHQERLHRCVDWTLSATAIRHHLLKCLREDIPPLSFSEALNNKIKESFLNGFLDESSALTMQEHWEVTLPLAIWDSENSGREETKICFKSKNNITDGLMTIIKQAVKSNDREILRQGIKDSLVLRVTNSHMTYLNQGLLEFKRLTTLSLCGNYIDLVNCDMLPQGLRALELQANRISNLDSFTNLPHSLLYLGLSRNILIEENMQGISQFPHLLTVLDLSENDIYHVEPLLELLVLLPNLSSLLLYGNPCSVCTAYATMVISRLHRLRWLDNRQILPTDRPSADKKFEPHPDDLRSAYFDFTILRIMSPPMPPKTEKGQTGLFYIELELPLLDSTRRMYLMFRDYETLTEMLPLPEDDYMSHTTGGSKISKEIVTELEMEVPSEETDIFEKLEPKSSQIIKHYTTFESNKVTWNKIMNFQEPTLRIFCPDLRALRDTFRSTITLRLVYSLTIHQSGKEKTKSDKSTTTAKALPTELFVTIATVKCNLKNPNWSQSSQHFHWDDSLDTNEAIHWGDGDLLAVQYIQQQTKATKGKQDVDPKSEKQPIPENLTMHFGFGIETMQTPGAGHITKK